MPPPDQRLSDLVRALRERMPRQAPSWTDGNQGDPGITLAEVFAYLGEQLGSATTRLPAQARAELARLGVRLLEFDRASDSDHTAGPSGTPSRDGRSRPDVRVNAERWTPIADLSTAGPDAAVFALDRASGAILFGDGVHGRKPPADATITVQYRYGGGHAHSAGSSAPPEDSWDGDN